MTVVKKMSYLIFAFLVLQLRLWMAESAIAITTSGSSKVSYARTDDKRQGVPSSLLDSIYHKSRQSRCATCYEDRRNGDDRGRYYSSYTAKSGDDRTRSWYHPSYDRGYRGVEYDRYGATGADRYESDRYGGDRYSADRYGTDRYGAGDRYGYRDDPYGARPSYDRYDSRTRAPYERLPAYERGEGRGYGYDNRDRYYGSDRGISDYYARDRYYERPRYGTAGGVGSTGGYGGYDRDYYDRYYPRYDFRHYRPRDDTYRGYSNSYYAKGSQDDRHYLSDNGYTSPCGLRRPNCQYSSEDGATRVTSDPINSGHYNMGVSQTNYHTNSNTKHNESSKGSGPSAGWSYMREDEQDSRGDSNSGSYGSNNNSEKQSSGYGALLDRGSNLIAVEPAESKENANDSMANSDTQKDTNVDETPKQSENEQNS